MEPTNEVMCPKCGVPMVNGECPQCGMKAEETTPAPETSEESTEETPAE